MQARPGRGGALVRLIHGGPGPGLLARIAGEDAETEGHGVGHRQVHERPAGLAANVFVVIGLAADDAAERDEARVALRSRAKLHGAQREAHARGHLEGAGYGKAFVGRPLLIQDRRGALRQLIREPRRTSLSDRLRGRLGKEGPPAGELRDYGVGAQILLDLGVSEMILLSNTKRTIIGLEGYGLSVVERRPIRAPKD